MQKTISLKLLPSEAANDTTIKKYIAKAEAIKAPAISGFTILKQSIDARGRQPWINLSLKAYINEPFQQREMIALDFKDVKNAERTVIITGACLLYTSDAADERSSVDLGGRRIIKKKTTI